MKVLLCYRDDIGIFESEISISIPAAIVINTSFIESSYPILCTALTQCSKNPPAGLCTSHETNDHRERQIARKRQFTKIHIPVDQLTMLPPPKREIGIGAPS